MSVSVLVLQIMGSVAWQAEIINCSQIKVKKRICLKLLPIKIVEYI